MRQTRLEYRADNWETSITGAMMIESAHRLIAGEREVDAPELPSAHFVSLGQSLRGTIFRFLLTPGTEESLKSLDAALSADIGIAEKLHAGTFAITVTEIAGAECHRAWPAGNREVNKRGTAIRLPDGMALPAAEQDAIAQLMRDLGLSDNVEQVLATSGELDLVVVAGNEIAHFYAYDGSERRLFGRSKTMKVSSSKRLPESYVGLAAKKVGIVGCGSLGSKVGAMLTRAGVREFLLIDDDVLLFDNTVRNELGITAVGVHKVDALRARIIEIAGTTEVTIRRVALGGQESADSTESVMSALGTCDVIVDATADAHCFNFCSAVAKNSLTPLVWGKVYGGGIGGLVVRVRPGYEPEPQLARNQISAWCDAQGVPAPVDASAERYATIDDGGAPLVADDAEVAIIAGHIARFVTDVLTRPDDSAFSVPAYAIGLRKGWIFTEPFDTRPIRLVGVAPWKVEQDAATAEESLEMIRELFPQAFNGDNQPAA